MWIKKSVSLIREITSVFSLQLSMHLMYSCTTLGEMYASFSPQR